MVNTDKIRKLNVYLVNLQVKRNFVAILET